MRNFCQRDGMIFELAIVPMCLTGRALRGYLLPECVTAKLVKDM